jgi:hypothetical protein
LEGSRRAFSADFIRTLADDFRLHGRQAIEKVRKTQPAAYLKICALLVPREMKLEHSGGVKDMTDEQIERSIELIKEMLAQREAGEMAKVIEAEAEVVPSLPAARAPRAATPQPCRRAWLRIFVVRCSLPCDPRVGVIHAMEG